MTALNNTLNSPIPTYRSRKRDNCKAVSETHVETALRSLCSWCPNGQF